MAGVSPPGRGEATSIATSGRPGFPRADAMPACWKSVAKDSVMARPRKKTDFPVHEVRRYLEPGPIVLVSSRWRDRTNIMTLGWHTVMEFSPSLVGCMISGGNHSFRLIRDSGECVINLPTTALTDTVVGIGNTSGAKIDKFQEFGLSAGEAQEVGAPLIRECHANFECRLHDDALVDRYNFFIFEVVKAHVAPVPKHPRTLHYTGGGVFVTAGGVVDRKALFRPGML
jgi:flavin reductase (DIM6/NTAB) family NADH-FMN oxidoreductase RutF